MTDGREHPSLRDLFLGALRSRSIPSLRLELLLFVAPFGVIVLVLGLIEGKWLLAWLGSTIAPLAVLGALGLQWRHVASGEEAIDRARWQQDKERMANLTWRGRLLYYAILAVILGLLVLFRVLMYEGLR